MQNRQAERAQSTLPTVHLHCYQLKQPLNSWHSIVKSVPQSKLPQLNMASSPPRFWNAPRSRQAVFYRFCRRIANAMIASVLSQAPPSFRTLFIIVDNRKEGSPIRRPLLPIFTCQFFFAVLYYMLYDQKPYSMLRSMSASECAPHMRIVSASSALSFWT